eukprot:SAG22_NODE_527_length_9437_cov_3.575712_3_plen_197_part_00
MDREVEEFRLRLNGGGGGGGGGGLFGLGGGGMFGAAGLMPEGQDPAGGATEQDDLGEAAMPVPELEEPEAPMPVASPGEVGGAATGSIDAAVASTIGEEAAGEDEAAAAPAPAPVVAGERSPSPCTEAAAAVAVDDDEAVIARESLPELQALARVLSSERDEIDTAIQELMARRKQTTARSRRVEEAVERLVLGGS